MRYTITILFFLYKAKAKEKDDSPIYCRLTQQGYRRQFATGIRIPEKLWDAKKNKAVGRNKIAGAINERLSAIKSDLLEHLAQIQLEEDTDITVDNLYNRYRGIKDTERTILEVFDHHNQQMAKLIGKDYAEVTYSRFLIIRRQLAEFIQTTLHKKDVNLKDLNMAFIRDFELFLKADKEKQQITVNKDLQRLRKVVRTACMNGWLDRDPFMAYKAKTVRKEVVFLSEEELTELEHFSFSQERLVQVRDMFIFSCYTGLAYNEAASLTTDNIVVGFDGFKWISSERKKTGKPFKVPLLPKAEQIILKYQDHPVCRERNTILPMISNQKFNSYLKEIAAIVGINKRLTHHLARKTFASTICLLNDVPMQVVSELLGHSSIKITEQHYGKVVQRKVSEAMLKLRERLSNELTDGKRSVSG